MPPEAAPLARYKAKRDFSITPEPSGGGTGMPDGPGFVVQKHWASRLHYDFRLELDGVMVSWAVPKGPSLDPTDRRMAVHVEDHPISYNEFEGTIPERQYGAGKVIVWDRGTWEPVESTAREGLDRGKLVFRLHGQKLAGLWTLVRTSKAGEKADQWMLFKRRDAWARPRAEYDVVSALPDSVVDKPLGAIEAREPARASPPAALAEARKPERPAILTPAKLAGAVRAPLPATLGPQLATLVKGAPPPGDWIYEIKFDGYRIMTRIERGKARLITRGGHDWTAKMAPLAAELESLGLTSAWLDGEAVVIDDKGTTNFNLLQNAFDTARTGSIAYFLFDVPFCDGYDLRRAPLHTRRALVRQIVESKPLARVRFSADFPGDAATVLASACAMKLEGVIAKQRTAPYVSSRSTTWLKLKCGERQEFVVVGFTDRAGAPGEVGALLLGYHENGKLRFAGSVGTGWDSATGAKLHKALARIETDTPPVDPASARPGRWSRRARGTERWVKPKLVAEVGFTEWTPEGHVRHPSFRGLREDKRPQEITREQPAAEGGSLPPATSGRPLRVGATRVSNPERVIDPSTGLRKLDLVRYYESIAEWMLPHLIARPVSLVRAPDGVGGQMFFQKHDDRRTIPGVRNLDPQLWPGHDALLEIPTAAALVNAAQMNVVEFHTWNSTTRHIDEPDRIVFDLDPGRGIEWPAMREAALLMRTLLEELGLRSWLKTSGGKGLHVVVPIAPKIDYDEVKDLSQAIVQHLARTIPARFVAKSGAENRVGKIYPDYLRNGHGQTTAAAFSARARPGLGVSMPVSWDDLPKLKSSAQWTIANAREYVSFLKVDPWADYWKCRQTLATAQKALAPATPSSPASRRTARSGGT